jgi:hypothetical protein
VHGIVRWSVVAVLLLNFGPKPRGDADVPLRSGSWRATNLPAEPIRSRKPFGRCIGPYPSLKVSEPLKAQWHNERGSATFRANETLEFPQKGHDEDVLPYGSCSEAADFEFGHSGMVNCPV